MLSNDPRHRRRPGHRTVSDVQIELRVGDRPPMLVRVGFPAPPKTGVRFNYGGAMWELTGLERGVLQATPVYVAAAER